jgi:hypothetical protein
MNIEHHAVATNVKKFLKRANPRPWRRLSKPKVKIHGLL